MKLIKRVELDEREVIIRRPRRWCCLLETVLLQHGLDLPGELAWPE